MLLSGLCDYICIWFYLLNNIGGGVRWNAWRHTMPYPGCRDNLNIHIQKEHIYILLCSNFEHEIMYTIRFSIIEYTLTYIQRPYSICVSQLFSHVSLCCEAIICYPGCRMRISLISWQWSLLVVFYSANNNSKTFCNTDICICVVCLYSYYGASEYLTMLGCSSTGFNVQNVGIF